MNHGNSISGGANPRRTFRTVDDERPDQENRCQNRSDQCQQCRILECHGRSMNAGSLRCNTGLIRSLSTLLHGIALSRRFEPEKQLLSFKKCGTNCCTIALRNPLKRTKSYEAPTFHNNTRKVRSFRTRQVSGTSPLVGSSFQIP